MNKAVTDDAGPYAGTIGQALSMVEKAELFTWFHLAQDEAPREIGEGRIWHGDRPSGPKFHDLVTLNIETDAVGQIERTTLCLDRQFVERPTDAAFARDIARSFLIWALPAGAQAEARSLIDEIGDLRPLSIPVIRHAGVPQPVLPRFPSPGYRTFLGYQGEHDQ